MNLKKTLLLGVLLVASIVYLKLVAFPSAKRAAEGGKVFEDLATTDLGSIRFTRLGSGADGKADAFELEKGFGKGVMPRSSSTEVIQPTTSNPEVGTSEDPIPLSGDLRDWGIRSLKGSPVDTATLSGVFSALKDMKLGEEIEQSELEKDFSVYGLSKPSLTLNISQKVGPAVEVAFGKKNEYLGQRYTKVSGRSGVYLVDEASFTAVNKSANDLRDRTPIRFEDPDLRLVELGGSTGKIKLAQTTVGEWEIQGDKNYKASTAAVGDLLRALKDLRVADFMDGATPSAVNGLAAPQHTITLHFRDGVTPAQLEVKVANVTKAGSTKGAELESTTYFTYTDAPSIFTTLASSLDKLPATFDGYREKRVFALAASDVVKLTVSGTNYVPVELSSDGVDWKVNGKVADVVFVDEVVENLMGLKVESFLYDGAVKELGEPTRRFEILKKGTASDKTVLLLGAKVSDKGGEYWIGQVEGRPEFFRLKDEDVRKVSPREETLLAPTPTPLPSPTSAAAVVTPK